MASTTQIQNTISKVFDYAGIAINGNNPWDLQVHDERFFPKVAKEGTMGMGESYMYGWIDSQKLDETIYRLIAAKAHTYPPLNWKERLSAVISLITNRQNKYRALEVGRKHYDLGNELFKYMLDKRMAYSCAYWKNASNIDEAQEAKLDLICRKLYLQPGMKVLDIGCGWGSFAKFAAEKYGVEVTGISISKEQIDLAKELCQGLPITFLFQDYRDVKGQYDRVVSIGQIEHVGYKNYPIFMKVVNRSLKDDGLFLLQTIGSIRTVTQGDPWLDKYIFPNGMLPSIAQLGKAAEQLLIMEDWHNFGAYYDHTLLAWHENFVNNWDHIKDKYDETFFRMWKYYLLSTAGAFRARYIQLWQLVFSKNGYPGEYPAVR